MRRNLLLLSLVLCTLPLLAQSAPAHKAATPAKARAVAPQKETELPIRRVVLYKNGVGYFEHAGKVSGTERLSFDFTTDQLNDVLQSLTALDSGGGKIGAVSYNSTTPLQQQLKALPLGLEENPETLAVYQAIRGERVEVTGAGATIVGRLVNIEAHSKTSKDGDTTVDHYFLILASDAGALRNIELTGSVSVRMLDAALQKQFTHYLGIIASARNQQTRHLTLEDRGNGERQLSVSYISQVPVWKSTYRLVVPNIDSGKATLQGWAIVDNTVGADWENVQLSLVAGSPQSFIQPLSTPYYLNRPEIGLPTAVMTTPQTHESGELAKSRTDETMEQNVTVEMAAPKLMPRSIQATGSSYGSAGGGVIGGMGGGSGAGVGSGVYRPSDALSEGDVETKAFDDFFEYAVQQPVTIDKNESAMVPILQTEIAADPVTLYSPNEAHPLRALWITNSSKLTLDRGSFSIYESGSFAGQGLLDPIHPGEKRLLSYAADDAIRISHTQIAGTRRIEHIRMAKGVLKETYTQIYERTYDITNPTATARTVLVEHPRHAGFECDSVPLPVETTANLYRFRVIAPPGETIHLHVGERHPDSFFVHILEEKQNNLDLLIRSTGNDATLMAKLQPVIAQREVVSDLDHKRREVSDKIEQVKADEQRSRDNITALKGDSSAARRFIDQLNQSEDQIDAARKQQTALDAQRSSEYQKLVDLVASLDFEGDVTGDISHTRE